MASYNGVQAAVLSRPGCRLILARSLLTSKNTRVAGGYPRSYVLSGRVRGMSALGPRGGLHCGSCGYLQVTLPVSCTVYENEVISCMPHTLFYIALVAKQL